MKPLLVSRCPLTERLPGLRSPEGAVLVHPDMTTALGCRELAGTTPGLEGEQVGEAAAVQGNG